MTTPPLSSPSSASASMAASASSSSIFSTVSVPSCVTAVPPSCVSGATPPHTTTASTSSASSLNASKCCNMITFFFKKIIDISTARGDKTSRMKTLIQNYIDDAVSTEEFIAAIQSILNAKVIPSGFHENLLIGIHEIRRAMLFDKLVISDLRAPPATVLNKPAVIALSSSSSCSSSGLSSGLAGTASVIAIAPSVTSSSSLSCLAAASSQLLVNRPIAVQPPPQTNHPIPISPLQPKPPQSQLIHHQRQQSHTQSHIAAAPPPPAAHIMSHPFQKSALAPPLLHHQHQHPNQPPASAKPVNQRAAFASRWTHIINHNNIKNGGVGKPNDATALLAAIGGGGEGLRGGVGLASSAAQHALAHAHSNNAPHNDIVLNYFSQCVTHFSKSLLEMLSAAHADRCALSAHFTQRRGGEFAARHTNTRKRRQSSSCSAFSSDNNNNRRDNLVITGADLHYAIENLCSPEWKSRLRHFSSYFYAKLGGTSTFSSVSHAL